MSETIKHKFSKIETSAGTIYITRQFGLIEIYRLVGEGYVKWALPQQHAVQVAHEIIAISEM